MTTTPAARAGSIAAVLLTTLAAIAALLAHGPSCGHDFDFHLVSWLEVARGWRSGMLTPHWITSANYGAGEPRLVFYPPASWLLGAGLGRAFGWSAAPALFTALCLLGAGVTMQRLARTWLTPLAATAAACLYIANPYMLFVAYERTAYGELLAAALIPLLLGFSVQARPAIATLAATVAGIWLTNAPAGVMACYALLWIAVLRLIFDRELRATLRLAAGTALGLALAAFYLAPAGYQQRWVEITRAVSSGMRIEDSFLFGHTGEPFHDHVLHAASIIACVLLTAFFLSLLAWREALRQRGLAWFALLAALIVLLLLPISTTLWRHTPHLAYLQFPWRWLLVLAPIAALFAAAAIARGMPPRWMAVCAIVLCGVSIVSCSRIFYQVCDDEDAVPAQVALLRAGTGVEGTDEYTPREDDNAEVDQQLPSVRVLISVNGEEPDSSRQTNPIWECRAAAERPASVTVRTWQPEQRDVIIDTPAAGYAVLRLMDYPAWLVKRDGIAVASRPRRDDGLLTVPIPAGHSHIEITWQTTGDVWTGRAITLVAVCVWMFLYVRERRSQTTI